MLRTRAGGLLSVELTRYHTVRQMNRLLCLNFHFSGCAGQVSCGLLLCFVADLDVIDDLDGARGLGHAGRRALMLHHLSGALPGSDAVLHVDLETILSDLGFCEFRLDGRLDLKIAAPSAGGGWRSSR